MSSNPAPNISPRSQPTREQQDPRAATSTKSKKNRNRRRRNRRPSFIAPDEPGPIVTELPGSLARTNPEQLQERVPYYRGRTSSDTSLESEALLDHR